MEIIKDGKMNTLKMELKPLSKSTSKRAADVEYFVAAINGDQIKARRKPYTVEFIAFKLSHVKTTELYPFFKRCLDYEKRGKGTFSKAFFGSLKIKK